MKRKHKRRHNGHRTPSAPGSKPGKTQRDAIVQWAKSGLCEDEIAQKLQTDKNRLRKEHIDAIKEGKAARAAAAEEEIVITKAEYHFLNSATLSFAPGSGWFDPKLGNFLFEGLDGRGAKNVDDAFAAWKASGGRYITSGLSNNFDPEKYAAFVKIVERYRQNSKEES
jgi:hypothetical protein